MEGFVERAGPRPKGQEHIVNPERVSQGQGEILPSGQVHIGPGLQVVRTQLLWAFSFSSPMFLLQAPTKSSTNISILSSARLGYFLLLKREASDFDLNAENEGRKTILEFFLQKKEATTNNLKILNRVTI